MHRPPYDADRCAYAGLPPERMIRQLKSRATRWLRERAGLPEDAPVWAQGGSRGYLWTEDALRSAVAYVTDAQDLPR